MSAAEEDEKKNNNGNKKKTPREEESSLKKGSAPSPEPAAPAKSAPAPDHEAPPAYLPKFPIVGIGASAGGIDAVATLLQRLASDSIAYVYVQHLAQGQENSLKDVLSKHTPAAITIAADGMRAEANSFYVAPAHTEITIHEGVFSVRPADGPAARLQIDTFLRSLAQDQKSAAIAVILSGTGTDGTLGLQAVKDEGGITFVQDPTTAAHPGMPQSALDSGFADFCLTAEEIADELMRLSAHPYVARAQRPPVLNKEPLNRIFTTLRDIFSVDFGLYKQSSIERRIQRRMALHKTESLEDYARSLDKDSTELNLLYHDLLIGVTSFFRDKEPFEALKGTVFPRIIDHRDPEVPIRIWVPGCSSGEEAYSIAICLLEFLGERAGRQRVQIFGTDIDEQALERARTGIYPNNIEVDVVPARLQRFFARAEKGYQISRQIREMVVFARHNLGKDPPFSRLDLISCRNVLIYLQPALQKKIVRVFHYALNPAGMLLLGSSESVSDDLFQTLDRRLKLYVKRNVPAHAAFDVIFGGISAGGGDEHGRPRPEARTPLTAQQLADRKVIEKYSPPGVVISENLDVVQFRGRTGPYLEPAPGNATLNLLRLARPEFLIELRQAVKKSFTEALPVSSSPIHLKDASGVPMNVRIDVLPLFDASASTKSLLVLFNDLRVLEEKPPEVISTSEEGNPRVLELERELATTKEYLQTTIEELETTNEELMSANEELQSSNEELQSTNEELSTSKEELQSTNEELSTVNEELHHRLAELSISNDDLMNLMTSPALATVIVGADFRIRRFSVAAEKLLHLVPADLGRPLSYLAGAIRMNDLENVVAETVGAVAARTVRVTFADGSSYDLRISPYKTADQAIRGAVLEFHRRG
jgi:two-component system CheB/CheR fusion protein